MFEKGKLNNGVAKYDDLAKRLAAVKPSAIQLDYLEMEYYNFAHFGMNTFTGNEWGNGQEDEQLFNPTELNTDQWCEAMKASGSEGIIITAKHHDGFCLWQTKTTEHCVRNSTWKDGKGDVVAELAASCKKYGLKLGVYLSPWDRNCPIYGKNSYNDFFVAQLTELVTGYGELFCLWFDGARGEGVQMDPDFRYDFGRFYSVIRKYQPNAVISICGPDVRWVGNEGGHSRKSEWSVVSAGAQDPNKVAEVSQKSPEAAAELLNPRSDSEDLGSRELMSTYNDYRFFPAEVDVSINPGWFYHANEEPKTLEHLLNIYYKAVGGNTSLLLNIPPDKRGMFDERAVIRLKEMGKAIEQGRSKSVPFNAYIGKGENSFSDSPVSKLSDKDRDGYAMSDDEYLIKLELETRSEVRTLEIREDLREGQHVEYFDVYYRTDYGEWKFAESATNIGNRRIVFFSSPVKTDAIMIEIIQTRTNPVIRSIELYE